MPFFGVPIRNGLPIGLGSVAGFGAPQEFSPSELFAGGTVAGAWYDPSDLSTMFDTSAGATQCAMPGLGSAVSVGLMLDKSQGLVGLGTQLVVNGDFSTGNLTNWQSSNGGSFALSSNRLQVTGAGANTTGAAYTLNTTVGAAYAVSFVVTLGTATTVDSQMSLSVAAGAGIGNSYQFIASNQTITYYFVATAATTYFQFLPRGTGLTAFIDDFSVKTLGPGNHAIAFNNTTARPELRARVNLLTYSEEFDNAAWVPQGATISTNTTTAPDGTLTADTLTENTATGSHRFNRLASGTTVTGANYVYSIALKANTRTYASVQFETGTGRWTALVDLSAGTIITTRTSGSPTGTAATISALGSGWYRVLLTVTASGTGPYIEVCLSDSATPTWTGDSQPTYTGNGTGSIYIWGADLRPANIGANVPAYQRIADANTYDTSGFPLYLRFDGIDDSMYTPANLNLSGTDKVAVFAGVRKLSDASIGVAMETSINSGNNDGALMLTTSGQVTPGAKYGSTLRGTALIYAETATAYAAPRSDVLALINDIAQSTAATEQIMRINGAQVALTFVGADAGTGNLGNHRLFIGSRNSASVWLNGQVYSLLVVGSAVSAGNIGATEQWVAGKTGITI